MKKPAAKVKPRPVNPKGTKKTPAAASAAPAVPAETTNNSVLAPEYQTLSKAAASVYTAIAPKSILLTSPEAAKILTTPARSLTLVSLFPTLLRFFRTNCSSHYRQQFVQSETRCSHKSNHRFYRQDFVCESPESSPIFKISPAIQSQRK